jgi:hypothetical protein
MATSPSTPGHDRLLCGAKRRQGDGSCHRPAGWGTQHPGAGRCKLHGGTTRNHQNSGHIALVEQQLHREQATLAALLGAADPVEDPLRELQVLAGEAKRWKQLVAGRVSGLTSLGYAGATGEQVKAEVQLLERAMDRLGHLLLGIGRLNIDERLARVSEQQAATVASALGAVLSEMGLSHDQQREARSRVARHLRVAAS